MSLDGVIVGIRWARPTSIVLAFSVLFGASFPEREATAASQSGSCLQWLMKSFSVDLRCQGVSEYGDKFDARINANPFTREIVLVSDYARNGLSKGVLIQPNDLPGGISDGFQRYSLGGYPFTSHLDLGRDGGWFFLQLPDGLRLWQREFRGQVTLSGTRSFSLSWPVRCKSAL